jgi:hypothetical protein
MKLGNLSLAQRAFSDSSSPVNVPQVQSVTPFDAPSPREAVTGPVDISVAEGKRDENRTQLTSHLSNEKSREGQHDQLLVGAKFTSNNIVT